MRLRDVERFPCEDHACGCVSAEECWHDCCCYTPHQRLVWAIRNGVTPPESVRVSENEWIAAANDVQPDSATCWSCVETLLDDLSHGIGRSPACGQCSEPDHCGQGGAGCGRGMRTAAISPAGCKGLVSLIVLSLPPARWTGAMSWEFAPVEGASRDDVQVMAAPRGRSLETPTPPPRRTRVAVHNV